MRRMVMLATGTVVRDVMAVPAGVAKSRPAAKVSFSIARDHVGVNDRPVCA
jgi:hypothetical protein